MKIENGEIVIGDALGEAQLLKAAQQISKAVGDMRKHRATIRQISANAGFGREAVSSYEKSLTALEKFSKQLKEE